jgi:hypothetical protein
MLSTVDSGSNICKMALKVSLHSPGTGAAFVAVQGFKSTGAASVAVQGIERTDTATVQGFKSGTDIATVAVQGIGSTDIATVAIQRHALRLVGGEAPPK